MYIFALQVAHTFLLGDKYSKPLNAVYLSKEARPTVLQMGSFGIGLTRLIAASIEILSLEQEMRWPDVLVPYSVVIITPKVVALFSHNYFVSYLLSGGFKRREFDKGFG